MKDLINEIGATDIYLIDQILKSRFEPENLVLDAGCGYGRNIKWFANNNFKVYGVDTSEEAIEEVQRTYPEMAENFTVVGIEDLPFETNFFDVVICSAVLHFASNKTHFSAMMSEMIRVLKPSGCLFIRMASNFATAKKFKHLKNGVYELRDGSERFLLTTQLLGELFETQKVQLLEPVKTTNVEELRCMTTLVLQKI